MNTDNSLIRSIVFFLIILFGALVSAALGAGFGALIAVISPEFIDWISGIGPEDNPVRTCAAMGMIWGLFIGAAAAGFACLLATIMSVVKIKFEKRQES